jgi:uncharacterized protein (TIGR03437 family)
VTVAVAPAAPALFTLDNSGKGQGFVLNEDGIPNSAANPATQGSVITLVATGVGQTDLPGTDDQVGPERSGTPLLPIVAGIGNAGAEVVFTGVPANMPEGYTLIRARVPADSIPGDAVPLVIVLGDAFSQPGVTVAIR